MSSIILDREWDLLTISINTHNFIMGFVYKCQAQKSLAEMLDGEYKFFLLKSPQHFIDYGPRRGISPQERGDVLLSVN